MQLQVSQSSVVADRLLQSTRVKHSVHDGRRLTLL